MTDRARIAFAKPGARPGGTVVAFAGPDVALGPAARALGAEALARRGGETAGFTGKAMTTLDLIAPAGTDLDRLIIIGTGKPSELKEKDWLRLGGAAMGALGKAKAATVLLERPDGRKLAPEQAADFALGMRLRGYSFDKYKKPKEENGDFALQPVDITIAIAEPAAARSAWSSRSGVADGVLLARDLVNEPANVLGPIEFAARAGELSALGVEVEVLGEKELRKLNMAALLGVAQGSARPPRVVVMRWNGGKAKEQPVCFIGKGVVFDTGGISIKPAAGMEDMKGDMGGRRRGHGPHARARCAQGEDQRHRHHRPGGEHARWRGAAARRHRHRDVGQDHRDQSTPTPRGAWCSPTSSPTPRSGSSRVS